MVGYKKVITKCPDLKIHVARWLSTGTRCHEYMRPIKCIEHHYQDASYEDLRPCIGFECVAYTNEQDVITGKHLGYCKKYSAIITLKER